MSRTNGNWRYRVLKHWRHKAMKFYEEAKTPEERIAWDKVVAWLDSHVGDTRYLNEYGSIAVTKEMPKP